jgi:hypothetical protein
MKYECFTVLHPWAYDLDAVDFKYVVNKDQVLTICSALAPSIDAKAFWLTFFKSQTACPADEFFQALKEVCAMNLIPEFFESNWPRYKQLMFERDFIIDLRKDSASIIRFVSEVVDFSRECMPFCFLTNSIRIREGPRNATDFFDEG